MIIALALTILINGGVTAGIMTLTTKHSGRPGNEMFMAPPQDGKMAPPQEGKNNPPQNGQNNQNTPPADQSANETDG